MESKLWVKASFCPSSMWSMGPQNLSYLFSWNPRGSVGPFPWTDSYILDIKWHQRVCLTRSPHPFHSSAIFLCQNILGVFLCTALDDLEQAPGHRHLIQNLEIDGFFEDLRFFRERKGFLFQYVRPTPASMQSTISGSCNKLYFDIKVFQAFLRQMLDKFCVWRTLNCNRSDSMLFSTNQPHTSPSMDLSVQGLVEFACSIFLLMSSRTSLQ